MVLAYIRVWYHSKSCRISCLETPLGEKATFGQLFSATFAVRKDAMCVHSIVKGRLEILRVPTVSWSLFKGWKSKLESEAI